MAESISLHIAGMHCAACVGRVEKALARVPGLQKVEVLLTDHRAQLELQPGWQARHIVQALEEAGYEAPLSQATLVVEGLMETVQLPRLEAALRAVPGVMDVAVNLAQSSVRLQALPSTPAAALLAAASAAGFKAALQPLQGDSDPLAAEAAALRRDLVIALVGTLPLLAPMLLMPFALHLHLPAAWQAGLALLVLLVPGRRLLRGAWSGLRARAPGMDLLVCIGSWSAFALSCWLWARGASGMQLYFESAAAIVCFVLLGRWLEGRAKHATGSAVRGLQGLMPAQAEVQVNGQWKAIPLAELQPGQRVRVRPGQRLPCDGRVESGRSHINVAHLSGEPLPQAVDVGDKVAAAALNLDGLLEITATQTAAASSLGQLVRLVETAQASKAPIQRLADRVAARFVPAVLGIALLTLIGWGLAGRWDTGLLNAVAVLVVACPCALGLATPTAVVVGIGQAAKLGLLVRDAQALELLASVQRIAFDKTGTLTRGRPQLVHIEPVSSTLNRMQLQGLAAALAQGSDHPLSRALRDAQGELPMPEAKFLRDRAGLGLEGEVDGQGLVLGSSRMLAELGVSTVPMERLAAAQAQAGRSVSWLAQVRPQPQLLALLAFGDEARSDAKAALAALRELGLKRSLLSGDRPEAALAMARQLGIDEADAVHGGLLPADKLSSLHAWRAQGERVAFVGDGLNDAPALAAADVGIAIGGDGGNEVSRAAAGLTLMRPQLMRLPQALRLARATMRTIKQNLGWAFGFNLLMIPLAIAGQLPPALAALAMAGSSLMVIGNALRLRRWKP
jgi:Cu+-exporting ATPase